MNGLFRVEICGGIASGKTTFAQLFRETADVITEDFHAVPFWRPFFESPGSYNFETELGFLLQHYHQVKRRRFAADSSGLLCCDFSFVLDHAYSTLSLGANQQKAFDAVLEQALAEIGPPNLIVHLQCSAATELRRIESRGRHLESSVGLDFLENLNRAASDQLTASPPSIATLNFNSETQDFASDVNEIQRCREQVLSMVTQLRKSVALR